MRTLKIIFLTAIILILASCSKGGDCYDSHKRIMEMKSYTADAAITVHGNKSSKVYKTKQTVDESGNIKIETTQPEELKGKVIIYNGQKWIIYHPLIKDVVEFDSLSNVDEVIYKGIIEKKFLMTKNLKEKITQKNNEKCIEFKADLPNSNDHKSYAKLYITEKNSIPLLLEIYNNNDKVAVSIEYSNFKYNPVINKEEFTFKK